jgi:hypothetical protein
MRVAEISMETFKGRVRFPRIGEQVPVGRKR